MEGGLGRLPPTDDEHIRKYPLTASPIFGDVPTRVEVVMRLPAYRAVYDQGTEGACVGYSLSWMMSILNRRRYVPSWLYKEAQKVDEWDGEAYSGTSVRAGADILGDQIRGCLAMHVPVVLGVNWYQNFDRWEDLGIGRDKWIGRDTNNLGSIRGGHAICCYGASDARQAVKLVNTWGTRFPLVWLPYRTLERLLHEDGEATMVVDK